MPIYSLKTQDRSRHKDNSAEIINVFYKTIEYVRYCRNRLNELESVEKSKGLSHEQMNEKAALEYAVQHLISKINTSGMRAAIKIMPTGVNSNYFFNTKATDNLEQHEVKNQSSGLSGTIEMVVMKH